jgi:predicted nucleic acid-binding Zn ribbon protein
VPAMDMNGEQKRPFEVHETCYDCAEFYEGCAGWRASRVFACGNFNRLPDVLPGTCGQRFPPPRRQAPASTAPKPIQRQPAESSRQPDSEPDTVARPQIESPPKNPPICRPGQPVKPKDRICGCGAALPKGKRLCDTCRTQNRRQTKGDYMRTYMEQRRSAAVGSDSHVPFPAAATPSTRASGGDLVLTGLRGRGCPFWPKFCTNKIRSKGRSNVTEGMGSFRSFTVLGMNIECMQNP